MGSFWKTVREVHFRPTDFFEEVDGESLSEPSKFAASVGLIFGSLVSLLGLLAVLAGEFNPLSWVFIAAIMLVVFPVTLVISAFFQSGLVHIAVYLFGGRGFEKSFNAITYPVSATALWGWIPVINFFAGIYSIYLQTKGVEKLHDMSFGKSLIAVVWPIILSIVLTVFFIIFAVLLGLGTTLA